MKANYKMTTATPARAAAVILMMVSGIATARARDAIRIRGAIDGVDGSTYVVKAATAPN